MCFLAGTAPGGPGALCRSAQPLCQAHAAETAGLATASAGGTARNQEGGSQAEGKAAKAAAWPWGSPLPLWCSQVSGGC